MASHTDQKTTNEITASLQKMAQMQRDQYASIQHTLHDIARILEILEGSLRDSEGGQKVYPQGNPEDLSKHMEHISLPHTTQVTGIPPPLESIESPLGHVIHEEKPFPANHESVNYGATPSLESVAQSMHPSRVQDLQNFLLEITDEHLDQLDAKTIRMFFPVLPVNLCHPNTVLCNKSLAFLDEAINRFGSRVLPNDPKLIDEIYHCLREKILPRHVDTQIITREHVQSLIRRLGPSYSRLNATGGFYS